MLQKLWQKCLDKLKSFLSKKKFNMWILPLQVILRSNSIDIYAPNYLVLNYVKINYLEYINNFFLSLNIDLNSINFLIGSGLNKKNKQNILLNFGNCILSKKYVFNNFIYSKSNLLAYRTSLNSCFFIPKKCKLLFLYGCTGLGKTHLINSIGNKINDIYKYDKKIVFFETEKFISNIKIYSFKNNIEIFRGYLKSANVLLMDNIHHLEKDKLSQKEFIYILDYFLNKECILVFTSYKNIYNLNLYNKIISKISSGLIIKINNIDYNIRYKFLYLNFKKNNFFLSNKNIIFISKLNILNVYKLKGILKILFIYRDYLNLSDRINIDSIKYMLYNYFDLDKNFFLVCIIQNIVSNYFKIRIVDLLSKFRYKYLIYPRQISIAISRKLTNFSLSKLGFFFKVNHSTIIYSCKKINKLCIINNYIKSEFNNLIKLVLMSKYEIFYKKKKNI